MDIAVVGTGLVGTAFLKQLKPVAARYNLNVVLIARSSKTIVSEDYSGLNIDNVDYSNANQAAWTPDQIVEFLSKSPRPAVLVDNTSNEEIANSYPKFLQKNISIVTPNKKAFSSSLALWKAIFDTKSEGLVYHESTVGAGLPIISTLNDLMATGDKVKKIEGILSGSLSYIFNEFGSSDSPFSEILSKAKELGYTEPDPREDINGLDFARKVTILSRLSGTPVESATSFPVESLIPKDLESVKEIPDFLKALPEYDNLLSDRREAARKQGKVLRYVGSIDLTGSSPQIAVGIKEYDSSHPFASLTGSDNVVSFVTDRYKSPLIIQGAGAGDAVTAMGVLADLIKVAQRKTNA